MNLILLEPDEWPETDTNRAQVTLIGRRLEHIYRIHRARVGDQLKVGLVNGAIGTGSISTLDDQQVTLDVELTNASIPPSLATLILALPRPKVLKRTLQTITSFGVKEIYLINSYRVEKSYWQSPFLEESCLREQLILGLEQSVDTKLPKIHLRKGFKPFVEDELAEIRKNKRAIVAHPKTNSEPFPHHLSEPCCLAIGPEGGFIPYEIEKLEEVGFTAHTLGPRILKVEAAVPAILSRCL
ncbi:MAG: 16S rRNA (uracil(1498)-N(3))-methyltransferase [Pseudomonadales bacterium]|nr:16S rRNA (uracil(1498)-N(3))-methyltransferase [Pseudomonadales bacterium]